MTFTTIITIQLTYEELQADRLAVAKEVIGLYREEIEGLEEVTVPQAAKLARVNEQTIRNWINDKIYPLKAYPMNKRSYSIRKKDLLIYLHR